MVDKLNHGYGLNNMGNEGVVVILASNEIGLHDCDGLSQIQRYEIAGRLRVGVIGVDVRVFRGSEIVVAAVVVVVAVVIVVGVVSCVAGVAMGMFTGLRVVEVLMCVRSRVGT